MSLSGGEHAQLCDPLDSIASAGGWGRRAGVYDARTNAQNCNEGVD